MTETEKFKTDGVMTNVEFASLGDGQVAYIRQMDGAEAMRLFPALTGMPEEINLFALLGADGTPLAITDTRGAAIANAIENDLEPVSVH